MSNEDRAKLSACLMLFVEIDALQKQLRQQQETMGKLLCEVIAGDRLNKESSRPNLIRIK